MIVNFFAAIGIIACLIFVIILFVYIILCCAKGIGMHLYKWKIEHRYEGGPTAKCFCKDCKFYDETTKQNEYNYGGGRCTCHKGWDVADHWFCWNATPRD